MLTPLYREIPYIEPVSVFALFHGDKGAVFLDSSLRHDALGRYSFIAVYPFEMIQSKNSESPFDLLDEKLKHFQMHTIPNLPPFQGGFAGYFGYELHQHLEKIPLSPNDDMHFPDLMLGIYDLVIAFDHVNQSSFIFSSGFPEMNPAKRERRAQERLEFLITQLNNKKYIPEKFTC